MALVLTRNQVREVDRRAIAEYGMSGLVLMENAGRGVADVISRLLSESGRQNAPVAIVCGKGNNGGDGYVIARHLDLRGGAVRVLLLCDPAELRGDAAANFAILEKTGVPIARFHDPLELAAFDKSLAGAIYLVDAMLGTGATGNPKSPIAEAIDRMNASGVPIVSVDVPSGVDCDTGEASIHAIRAAHTCTFVAAKPGLIAPAAIPFVGNVSIHDIGVPRSLIDEIRAK